MLAAELEPKGVKCPDNFYDVALDYIVVDSFEDLVRRTNPQFDTYRDIYVSRNLNFKESPPSSVLAVLRNRWLSDGFKESALSTACWGVLQAKRRLMVVPDGFKARSVIKKKLKLCLLVLIITTNGLFYLL